MAVITATALTIGTGASATSFSTASISPAANQLVIVSVSSQLSGVPNTPTVTGSSMTWAQIGTLAANSTQRITLFRALAASPGTGALTVDFGGQTQSNAWWSLTEFNHVDISGTNGANAVVQSATNSANGTFSSFAVTLSAFGSPANATYGVVGTDTLITHVAGGSFTQLDDDGNISSEWANTNQTNVNWTWGSTGSKVVGMAIEIKAQVASGMFLSF